MFSCNNYLVPWKPREEKSRRETRNPRTEIKYKSQKSPWQPVRIILLEGPLPNNYHILLFHCAVPLISDIN